MNLAGDGLSRARGFPGRADGGGEAASQGGGGVDGEVCCERGDKGWARFGVECAPGDVITALSQSAQNCTSAAQRTKKEAWSQIACRSMTKGRVSGLNTPGHKVSARRAQGGGARGASTVERVSWDLGSVDCVDEPRWGLGR